MSAIQRAPFAFRNSASTPAISGTAIRMERNGDHDAHQMTQLVAAIRPSSMTRA